jgi:hypothetical protein
MEMALCVEQSIIISGKLAALFTRFNIVVRKSPDLFMALLTTLGSWIIIQTGKIWPF